MGKVGGFLKAHAWDIASLAVGAGGLGVMAVFVDRFHAMWIEYPLEALTLLAVAAVAGAHAPKLARLVREKMDGLRREPITDAEIDALWGDEQE